MISESTVDGNGPFFRPENDYFFVKFGAPQDVGTPQNFSSRNTKHLRAFWDSVPRWLHYGFAHTLNEILLAPDSPLLQPLIDQLGTSNLVPLIVGGQINPMLAANNIRVIKDTHGKTSHLSASDLEALTLYLRSLDPLNRTVKR